MKDLGEILVIIAAIAALPLLTIWSVNTLFVTGIPYTFPTWAAALWLAVLVAGIGIDT